MISTNKKIRNTTKQGIFQMTGTLAHQKHQQDKYCNYRGRPIKTWNLVERDMLIVYLQRTLNLVECKGRTHTIGHIFKTSAMIMTYRI